MGEGLSIMFDREPHQGMLMAEGLFSLVLYKFSIALLLKACRINTAITTRARQIASFRSVLFFRSFFAGAAGVVIFI